MKQPAKRVMTMSPFLVVQILTRARSLERAGYKVIHMEAGEPNLPLPLPVQEALRQAASQPMGYTEAGGMLALRERIAAFYANQFGVTVDARRIFLTTGVSSALLMLLASIADSGEKVLIPDPGYPCYRQLLNFLGIIPEVLPLAAKRGYLPDIAQIQQVGTQAKALILASPANPTGVIMPSNRLGEILAICQAMDLFVIMDEIYAPLTFDEKPQTVLALNDEALVVSGFSKYFGMTGLRLGWAIVPEFLLGPLETIAQNLYIAPPTPAQYAAMAAFLPETLDELEKRKKSFQARRDFLVANLQAIGFKVPVLPDGGFYIYADASAFTHDSLAFCHDILEKVHVAITPGEDFGSYDTKTKVRFSFTAPLDDLQEGIARLKRYLNQYLS
jgi:aspartate/methionine/tyrosine aminotransferase